jgi:hypothetical protein
MIHDYVHYLFILFTTTHNVHYVDYELWFINMTVWRKLLHRLKVWSLDYHHYDLRGAGELLIYSSVWSRFFGPKP